MSLLRTGWAPRFSSASLISVAAVIFLMAVAKAPQQATAPMEIFPSPELVSVLPRPVSYRMPGEFIKASLPVDGPLQKVVFPAPLEVMKYQVTEMQYARCVNDGVCADLDDAVDGASKKPVTEINFLDAQHFAGWLSENTGDVWRLPTDREWAALAGSRYLDDAIASDDSTEGPAQRWLKQYDSESAKAGRAAPQVQAQGHFGANEYGINDLSGNVWEWTSSCYVRSTLSDAGVTDSSVDNCGVRIVEGAHRAYMTTFIRNAKGGGCSTGAPPAHLGLRLIHEQPGVWSFRWVTRLFHGPAL